MANQVNFLFRSAAIAAALFGTVSAVGQAQQKPPYWASVEEQEARMRTGPSTEFPVKWVYKRQNLPVKVVAVHSVWRKIEDPDGDQGWVHVRLLSPKRTAIVIGTDIGALRDSPEATAHISWRVEPGGQDADIHPRAAGACVRLWGGCGRPRRWRAATGCASGRAFMCNGGK